MSKMPELLPYAVGCISTVKFSLNIIVVSCKTLSGRTGGYPDDNLIKTKKNKKKQKFLNAKTPS